MNLKRFLKKKIILIVFLVVFIPSAFFLLKGIVSAPWNFIEHPLVRQFIPTWRSLKEIVDLPYIFYKFKKSELPTYYLIIDPKKIVELNLSLPQEYYFSTTELTDELKTKVKAKFVYEDYQEEVRVRYRGLQLKHWNNKKKSWLIEFPKENLFQGNKILDFIIPEDRAYLAESLNVYRAEKLGLLTPKIRLANLDINGEDMGVYLVNEHWSEEFLETHKKPVNGQIYSTQDLSVKTDYNFLKVESIPLWKARITRDDLNKEDFNDLALLFSLTENKDEEIFSKNIGTIFDLEKFYNWMLVVALASSEHHGDSGNMDFYFDSSSGKLELMPRDVEFGSPKESLAVWQNSFISRLLADPEIRKNVEKRISEYVSDEKNLEDDVRFYDELWEKTKRDFFADSAKSQSSSDVKKKVEECRSWIAGNFENLRKQISENGFLNFDLSEQKGNYTGMEKRGSFSTFDQISQSIDEFVSRHPVFVKTGENKVKLFGGNYYFNETIIVPKGLELTVGAGTTIYFGKNTSLISYSPVWVVGNADLPVRIARLNPKESWGTFAVIGTKNKKSEFNNVYFSGGSGAVVHGIYISGMLAVHDGDVDIWNSRFENAGDDDAVNIKSGKFVIKNSIFKNNAFDAIDSDSSEGEITGCEFFDNLGIDGDSIDLSFSEVLIKDNNIKGCGDKGISVGEQSRPVIENDSIKGCPIGIAVKDDSYAQIKNCNLIENGVGVSLYRKKQIFGGGKAFLTNVVFKGNIQDTKLDNLSELNYENF